MTTNKGPHKCCEAWDIALETGTDSEAYGSLIHYYHGTLEPAHYCMGASVLASVKFCPWCGAQVKP
jgi:hypothetical protein